MKRYHNNTPCYDTASEARKACVAAGYYPTNNKDYYDVYQDTAADYYLAVRKRSYGYVVAYVYDDANKPDMVADLI